MKFCSKCGKKLSNDAVFCSGCGGNVETQHNETQENKREEFIKTVKKCPACGELLKAYEVRCPSCNNEISSFKKNNRVDDLIQKINELENEKKSKKKRETDIINNQIYNLIEGYQVSNNKEELFEFILLAREKKDSYISSDSDYLDEYYSNLRNVWKNKYKQAYQKAVFLYENDPDFILIKEKRMDPKKKKVLTIGILCGIGVTIALILSIIFGSINSYNNKVNDPNMTTVGVYSSDLKEKNYLEVVSIFESRGFTNI